MLDLGDLTTRLQAALVVNPAAVGSFKLSIADLGVIRVDGGDVSNDDAPAQCTMSIAADDFAALLEGRLDPQAALFAGRLQLDGDVAIAQAMQPALATAWLEA